MIEMSSSENTADLASLEELLEDVHDLAIIAERRDEPTIAFEELRKKLRRDGLL